MKISSVKDIDRKSVSSFDPNRKSVGRFSRRKNPAKHLVRVALKLIVIGIAISVVVWTARNYWKFFADL